MSEAGEINDLKAAQERPGGVAVGAPAPIASHSGPRLDDLERRRRAFVGHVSRTLRAWAEQDASRLSLGAPVALGAGAAVYFGLSQEPSAALLISALAVLAVSAAFARQRPWAFAMLMGAALFVAGAVAADWRTDRVSAPMIPAELSIRTVTGVLEVLEEGAGRRRLTIRVEGIDRLYPEETPALVRVTWRGAVFDAAPGDRIAVRAGLSPPPEPVAPGAFDFARHLFFMRIGAVGYMVAPPERLAALPGSKLTFVDRAAAGVERWRNSLASRITSAAPGQGGAIVAALVTGKRAAINEASETALRDSGLAHLLAISGLHMGLAAALIFVALRAALALSPAIALRYPIKKWAAAAALLSCFIYLLLSGGGWSARRAFIMTAVVFVAIIADRRAFSLRNVAIAATIILITTPEAVLHPGFQMSFAAATALIAAFDWARPRFPAGEHRSVFATVRRYAIGVAATDTVAATATAPFGLFHFHHAAAYSLAANMIATPLMAGLIMPFAILGLVFSPLGIDGVFWRLAAFGVDLVLSVGAEVSAWRGAVLDVAQWPGAALALVSLGGLWLCLTSAPWRAAGLGLIAGGFALGAVAPQPVAFVGRDGDNGAALITGAVGEGDVSEKAGGQRLAVFDRRKDRFSATLWGEIAGLHDAPQSMRETGPCDAFGCVATTRAGRIAFSKDPMGLSDDCALSDFVVALYPVPSTDQDACAAPLIDRRDAWRDGAHALYLHGDEIVAQAARPLRGVRPWTMSPGGDSDD
ncbi:MAG: ComEC/Rec2 family competence protein [Pseudomonadota bacterium]